jgi:hypothetical protein
MAGSNDGISFNLMDQRDGPNPSGFPFEYTNYAFLSPYTPYRYVRFIIQNYQSNDPDWYFRFGINMRKPDGSFAIPVNSSASPLWYADPETYAWTLGLNTTNNINQIGPGLEGGYQYSAQGNALYSGANYVYVGTSSTTILIAVPSEPAAPADLYATVIADAFTSASDARLKKDVKELDGALDKLDAIRGVTYHWVADDQSPDLQVGVIAQEIQAVYPELVKEGGNGFLSVDYPKLTAVLIQSVKELKAMVKALVEKQA